jgi:hypothetical protein
VHVLIIYIFEDPDAFAASACKPLFDLDTNVAVILCDSQFFPYDSIEEIPSFPRVMVSRVIKHVDELLTIV